MNKFCNSVKDASTSAESFKRERKSNFSDIFFWKFWNVLKGKSNFRIKKNKVQQIFNQRDKYPLQLEK